VSERGFCAKCGTPMQEGGNFCGKCGHRRSGVPAAKVPSKPERRPFALPVSAWTWREWTTICFACIALFGIWCGLTNQKAPETNPSAEQKTKASRSEDQEFDTRTRKLAPGFAGNDIEAIWTKLEEHRSQRDKGEFETSEEFRKRQAQESNQPLVGQTTRNSTLAFVVDPEYGDVKYNPDTRVLQKSLNAWNDSVGGEDVKTITVKSIEAPTIHTAGQNAFGVEAPIAIKSSTDYLLVLKRTETNRFRKDKYENPTGLATVNREEAKDVKDRVRTLVICKLVPPFSSDEKRTSEARLDDKQELGEDGPTERHWTRRCLHVTVLDIWFFDQGTGTILASARRP